MAQGVTMTARGSNEWERFAREVREVLVPKVRGTQIVVSIVPLTAAGVDAKFAVELGVAVMLDKPILAVVRPGLKIPEKLARVVDRFVEVDDISDPAARGRFLAALEELARERGLRPGGEQGGPR
jgi:hypothetical protein